MVCKNCGANLKGTPHRCPLCDFKFEEGEKTPQKRKRGSRVYKNPFTPIYIFTLLVVVVALVIARVFSKLDDSIWFTVLVSGITLYFFLRHTILGVRNLLSKTTYLSIAICLLMIILFETFDYKIGYALIYPLIQVAIFGVSFVMLFAQFKVFKPYASGLLTQALLSIVPLVISLVAKESYVFPLVVASLETLSAICLTILFPKEIWSQIKRFFAS